MSRSKRTDLISQARRWKLMATLRWDECLSYLVAAIAAPDPDQRRLLIFAQGRTGSTLLEDLLTSTGHFRGFGEILSTGRREILRPILFLNGTARRCSPQHFLCHIKIAHLRSDRRRRLDARQFFSALVQDGWTIIHLRRRNKLRHVLSNLIAQERGRYHARGDSPMALPQLTIDCEGFIARVETRIKTDAYEAEMLEGTGALSLVYEDDLQDSARHQDTTSRLLEAIGLESRPAGSGLRRINAGSLADVIENYDEFRERMRAQGWEEWMADH